MLAVIRPQSRAITQTGTDKSLFSKVKNYFGVPQEALPQPWDTANVGPVDVNQGKSTVGRDQIGVQNINNYHNSPLSSGASIENLLHALQEEMKNNQVVAEQIAKLQRFQKVSAYGGVVGLQAKLDVSGRAYEYDEAIEMKELFAKLLEEFSHYASAQEIIVYLLARVEYHFRTFIYPQLGDLSAVQVNLIVDEKIITPTVYECGASVFKIDHSVAMGMVYWLAEQCHVRWHQ